jgi:hypothetical protein
MEAKIFDLRALSMSDAYGYSQWGPVRHGDVMVVADGVAVLCQAWPIMVVGTSTVFHQLASSFTTWEGIAQGLERPGMSARLLAGVAAAGRPAAELAELAEIVDPVAIGCAA